MLLAWGVAATLLLSADTPARQAPSYTVASIVNAASNAPGALAPNTFATIYGAGLSYVTRALTSEDVPAGTLPIGLGGVSVLVADLRASVYYVSPGQINFLVPPNLRPGDWPLRVALDAHAGPEITIRLWETAPALFQAGAGMVVATHPDWSLVGPESPAAPGETISLFATGLGTTAPPAMYRLIPLSPAPLQRLAEFRVLLDGVAVEAGQIFYAGLAPGFAGLYQINARLPSPLGANPEIRIAAGGEISPPGPRLAVRNH